MNLRCPGVNFPYYDPARVNKVYALEPNPGMVRRAQNQRRRTELDVEFLDLPGERIPLPEASVDTVVSTFTLCTIPGVADAIRGIARVLRPGGQFLFFEHGLSPMFRCAAGSTHEGAVQRFEALPLLVSNAGIAGQGEARSRHQASTWRHTLTYRKRGID
jgi:SAM-dependent methyltransferase